MDQGDAEFFGVGDVAENDRLSVDFDLSLIRRIGAAEDLHQRALARAVLAHQREHFATLQVRATRRRARRRRGIA